MPLVVLCGQPSCGKSTVAALLADAFRARGLDIQTVDEPSFHLVRNEAYKDTPSEKNTRGLLRAATERALAAKSAVTLLDSLNNIKGYRYELWCIARAAGTKYCMVHVDTPTDTCASWNSAREGDKYSDDVFADLAGRFERPDARNRWDAPLFTVRPAGDPEEAATEVAAIVTAVAGEEGGEGAAPANPTTVMAKALKPTTATSNPALAATNALHDIDGAVQEVVDAVAAAQDAAAGGPAGLVRVSAGGSVCGLRLTQHVSLAELRRHKRGFMKVATKVTFARLQDPDAARRLFVDYLVEHVAGAQAVGAALLGAVGRG